jgi:hypothetical protein
VRAHEQRVTQGPLEIADTMTDGRGRQVQRFGGRLEAVQAYGGIECLQ